MEMGKTDEVLRRAKSKVEEFIENEYVQKICTTGRKLFRRTPKIVFGIVCLLMVFVFKSCSGGSNSSNETAERSNGLFRYHNNAVVIKGLYIGMPENECASQIKKLAEKYSMTFTKASPEKYSDYAYKGYDTLYVLDDDSTAVSAYGSAFFGVKKGELVYVEFRASGVEKVFNAGDMKVRDFAQAIVDNYSVPEFKVSTDSGGVEYRYEDKQGRGVKVIGRSWGKFLEMYYQRRNFD